MAEKSVTGYLGAFVRKKTELKGISNYRDYFKMLE